MKSDDSGEEVNFYSRLYAAGGNFAASEIRSGLLRESEECFCEQLRTLASEKRVLEIGCGYGEHSWKALQAGANVVLGTDAVEKAVERARERWSHPQLRFASMNAEALSLPDNSFDLVIDHEALSSVSFSKTISEIHRVLRPGGAFLGIECLGHNPLFNLNRLIGVLRGRRTRWAADHILKLEGLAELEARFGSIETRYFHLLLPACAALPRRMRRVEELVSKLDRFLLAKWKRLAFKVVFVAVKQP